MSKMDELQSQQQFQRTFIFLNETLVTIYYLLSVTVSFGKALFNDRSHAARSLQTVPADRFFLETDDARDLAIESVYARAAQIRGVTQEEMMAAGVRPDSIFML